MRELRGSEAGKETCEFWVRPVNSGDCSQFRLNAKVDRISPAPTGAFTQLALTEQDSGEYLGLLARIKLTDRHGGRIDNDCPYERISLRWCGVKFDTCSLLGAHGIHCLGDLKLYAEKDVCEKLIPPHLSLTEQTIDRAVRRYIAMRKRLKKINVTHNPCATETGLATADQLRAALSV